MNTTKKHALTIQLRSAEGAVLRTIGLMERRGFRLESAVVEEAQGDGQTMEVRVSSERGGELLKKQLERLHDVLWVEIETAANAWAGRAGNRPVDRSI